MNQFVPTFGPACIQIIIGGKPYTGAFTRRAIKAAVTRARRGPLVGIRTVGTNGDGEEVGYLAYHTNALAYFVDLG